MRETISNVDENNQCDKMRCVLRLAQPQVRVNPMSKFGME